jgi:hypothetical protein
MSIGAQANGEAPIAAQTPATSLSSRPPPKRISVAKTDTVAQPEPR